MRALAIRALEAFADLAGNVADRAEDVARRLRRDGLPVNHPATTWPDFQVIDETHIWTRPSPELAKILERMRQNAGQPYPIEFEVPTPFVRETYTRGWE